MSIEEILQYAENPNTKDFLSIAENKLTEINTEILRLERTRQILQAKKEQDFRIYDGLFTPAMNHDACETLHIKPAGKYLCGYQRGIWEKLPGLYRKMLSYASEHHMALTGYAYEMGMNDFVISNKKDYITRIVIQIPP